MLKNQVFGFMLISLCLLIFGGLRTLALQEKPSAQSAGLTAISSYEARVQALREKYAAERKALGLITADGTDTTPESDLGDPDCDSIGGGGGGGGSSPSAAGTAGASQGTGCAPCSKGAPAWVVNMINLNFYMADTPLWHQSPIGPAVEIKLSYNSLASNSGPVGNKWQLNYGSYASAATDRYGLPGIQIIMPDGKQDFYPAGSGGGYTPPYRVFNTLTKVADNHFELKFPEGTVYVYKVPAGTAPSVSLLTEIIDSHGLKLTMGYDANGKLNTITDAAGKVTSLSYNSGGLLTKAADSFGRSASFEYDANKNLAKLTDMGGYWTSFTYRPYPGGTYHLESLTNAGGTWGFYFEPVDRIPNGSNPYPAPGTAMASSSRITITNPSGGKEEYFRGQSTWHVSPRHYTAYTDAETNNASSSVAKTLYKYVVTSGFRGQISEVISPQGISTGLSYEQTDGSGKNTGNLTGIFRGGMGSTFAYNSVGRITSINGNLYPATTRTYAPNGVDLTAVTDGLGTVKRTYNSSHDVTSLTDRLGQTKIITYNDYGQMTSVTDELGTKTDYTYDGNHFLTQVTKAGQAVRRYTHDGVGRIRTYTDATGLTLTYDYNDLNDVTKVTYPDGKSISLTYSSSTPRQVTAITDRAGKTTSYIYGAAGKLSRMTTADGRITRFERDADGNLTRLTDPKGNATKFDYDNDNRRVKKTFADGTSVSFTYDEVNHVSTWTNSRNGSASYIRDPQGNLGTIMYPLSQYGPIMVMYQYDAYKRRTGMVDDSGSTTYEYDAQSRVTRLSGPSDNDARSFQYDAKGRLTGYTVQGGQSVTYSYDAWDRITSVKNEAGTFSYTYTGPSPLVQKLTRPNGSYTEYLYDNVNRLTGVKNKTSAGEVINQFLYSYNDQGLRSEETIASAGAAPTPTAGSVAYAYNRLNQLRSATNPDRPFTFDADGNLTRGYTPDDFGFTANYDFENRLASLQAVDETEYEYNGDGILATKTFDPAFGPKTKTRNVLYGPLSLQERDSANQVQREYTWDLRNEGGIGGLLSLRQGGQNYFYLYDGKGNVSALIDSTQSVVATYAYDPFGNVIAKTGTLDQPYQFSTKPYDEKTGLYNYGFRFYAPSIGRWTTRDPLGEAAGLNLYEFVSSNPVNRVDFLGLEGCEPGGVQIEYDREPMSSQYNQTGDEPYIGGYSYCNPEKGLWDRLMDWLDSLQQRPELGPDRAAPQCRITAGTSWYPNMGPDGT